jgi:hypothetical protein
MNTFETNNRPVRTHHCPYLSISTYHDATNINLITDFLAVSKEAQVHATQLVTHLFQPNSPPTHRCDSKQSFDQKHGQYQKMQSKEPPSSNLYSHMLLTWTNCIKATKCYYHASIQGNDRQYGSIWRVLREHTCPSFSFSWHP